MKVFAITPVFNRLLLTIKCVESLLAQNADIEIDILIIDDGSTDGTGDYFKNFGHGVKLIRGDGSLYWGGAINLGLKSIFNTMGEDDYVLFVNNDTILFKSCIDELISASLLNDGAIVGAIVCDAQDEDLIVDVGPKANLDKFHIYDIKNDLKASEVLLRKQLEVDFLSGRGVLYPASVIKCTGLLRVTLLPHYYSDYEYSYRASRRSKKKLLISTSSKLISSAPFSVEKAYDSRIEKYLSTTSIHNLYRRYFFFALVGTLRQRLFAPFKLMWADAKFFSRLIYFKVRKKLIKNIRLALRCLYVTEKNKFVSSSENSVDVSELILDEVELAPVVIFVYNRFEHMVRTIDSLRANELSVRTDLIFYSDGPKNDSDKQSVIKIRNYIKQIEGFRKVRLVDRENNEGLACNIINGVTDVLKKYGKVIVLEDDMEVSPYFLDFMNKALSLYENSKNIWHVAAWNEDRFSDLESNIDAVCWRFMNCWGWATWADRWAHFEKDPDKLIREFDESEIYRFNLNGSNNLWAQVVNNAKGNINTWAIFWYASIFKKNGLCINSYSTLVNNIGLDGSGVHCGEMKLKQKLMIKPSKTFPKYAVEDVAAMSLLINNYESYK